MPLGESDAAALFADLYELGEAVAVSKGQLTTHGVLRRGQQVLTDRAAQVGWVSLLEYPSTGFPVAVNDQLTIDGETYVVRDVPPQDDAAVGVAVVELVP